MPEIAIMTDSNCGIMPGEGDKLGIHVLPMPVIIDGQTYYEGIDISLEEFHEKQMSGADITTSQPSPGDVTAMWDDLLQDHDEVVFIPMSSGLSNTCQTASMLSADERYEGKVFVIDNHRISVTQAQSVLDAQVLASEGRAGSEIKTILEKEAMDASIYIAVDTLEYLKKGGRVTPAAAAFASVLNVKPVLTIQGDKLDTFAKVRGMKQAKAKMIEALKEDRFTRFGQVPDGELRIETAGTFESRQEAEQWCRMVQAEFPTVQVSYVDLPCSIACHVGINAVGTGIVKKEII